MLKLQTNLTMIVYDTVKQYSQLFNNPTLHPLISFLDLAKSDLLKRTKFMMNIYAIVIKETNCGDLRYGNKYYDYDEGTVVFFSPGQIITPEPEGELHQPYGKALVFHPDLIKGTSLGKQIHEYSFFSITPFSQLFWRFNQERNGQNCLRIYPTKVN